MIAGNGRLALGQEDVLDLPRVFKIAVQRAFFGQLGKDGGVIEGKGRLVGHRFDHVHIGLGETLTVEGIGHGQNAHFLVAVTQRDEDHGMDPERRFGEGRESGHRFLD